VCAKLGNVEPKKEIANICNYLAVVCPVHAANDRSRSSAGRLEKRSRCLQKAKRYTFSRVRSG
jgi:hypothetical protein